MKKFLIVVFGITSNLAQLKLIPALFGLYKRGLVKEFKIIGLSHQERSQEEYEKFIRESVKKKHGGVDQKIIEEFIKMFSFASGDVRETDFYDKLNNSIKKIGKCENKIFYVATHPELYGAIFKNIHTSDLVNKEAENFKLMIEKPIGDSYKTAKGLNDLLGEYFSEEQIFRIDHYLGKETIQNIMAFRFGNAIFEPLMRSQFIDHIQITASETVGAEARNAYYDKVGALKDVGQNHLLQMLAFATMEEPKNFDNSGITSSRLGVLSVLKPLPEKLVLGQYEGYSQEGNKSTNTFFAFKTMLTWGNFENVPIYIRAGKKLKKDAAEIAVVFKGKTKSRNALIYRIQPNEGVVLRIMVKKPSMGLALEEGLMQFCYKSLSDNLINPYERLLFDALNEDQTFFNDASEVEAQWKFIDSLESEKKPIKLYKSGGWGPEEADRLIKEDGREWIVPSDSYCNR